jgi:Flp pilus assembly protein TadD
MYRIAESMRKTGNYDSAISIYKQVLQNDPNNPDLFIGISKSLRGSGRVDAALETLTSVPSNISTKAVYQELGSIYTAKQNPRQCIRAYQKAYAMDQNDLLSINGTAVCHDLMGMHAEAEKWYRIGLSKSPSNEKLKSNMGLSLALAGKTGEAIQILSEVIKSPDATSRDRQNLAMAYGLSGNLEEAAKIFSQDLDKNAVRSNLAFIHKMSQTKQVLAQKPVQKNVNELFEKNLVSEGDSGDTIEEVNLATDTTSETTPEETTDFWASVETEIDSVTDSSS